MYEHISNHRALLTAIEGKEEFIVIDKGDYTVIDYVFQQDTTFDNPLLHECRGIKFDRDGLILARPLPKFFNYGEKSAHLPIDRPHAVLDKLDGSMIHPTVINGGLYMHTRKGHTDVAKKAERHAMLHPAILQFCFDWVRSGWTPIFEFTGPNNRIVLPYKEAALTLLAIRRTVEGTFMPYSEAALTAKRAQIPIVEPFITKVTNVESFVEQVRALEEVEGYVIQFDDGYMVKIKADDYVLKHRALDDMSSKKKVVALCAQGFMDDVLPILSDDDKHELMTFNNYLQMEISKLVATAESLASMVLTEKRTRKEFALGWAPQIKPKWLAGVAFGIMDGKEPRKMVIDGVIKDFNGVGAKWRGD